MEIYPRVLTKVILGKSNKSGRSRRVTTTKDSDTNQFVSNLFGNMMKNVGSKKEDTKMQLMDVLSRVFQMAEPKTSTQETNNSTEKVHLHAIPIEVNDMESLMDVLKPFFDNSVKKETGESYVDGVSSESEGIRVYSETDNNDNKRVTTPDTTEESQCDPTNDQAMNNDITSNDVIITDTE